MTRRSHWCLATLILILFAVPIMGAWAGPLDHPHVSDQVIIKFKANTSQAEKDAVLIDLGASHIKHLKRIKSDLHRVNGLSVGQAIGRYKNHPKVEYIEPNYIIEADEIPNDTRFNELWGMLNTGQTGGTAGADISATAAWDVFTGSDQVLIGVIDTGVDYTHPDLAANIYTNPGEIPGNGVDDDNNGFVDDVNGWDFYNDDSDPMDDNGHGSHCSGTIGGVGNNGIGVAGVCWNVKILPIKFLSGGGSGSTADAIDSVEYATLMGVNLTSNSWGGGGFSQALSDAIADANAAGILFVAAAGNSGANTDVSAHYPSSYDLPNIVSVAATDHNDQLASFSNYGLLSVDLAAPGVAILSTFPGNSYGELDGTSMATPHVAGAFGLVFGRFPAIGHLDAKSLLLNFVDPLPNLSGVVATGGRLNAFFPIADPDSIPPAPIADLVVVEAGSNWLDVGWTATGDDGATGTASRYVAKYSTSPIDDLNFDAATTAPNPPDPGPSGTPETMRIAGLDFSTTYYVAVKALDEFGNASDASNSPNGTTLGAPDIAAAPLSFTETLLTGATSTQALTLSNVGLGTLDYEIPLPQLITTAPIAAAYVNYGKDGADPRPGLLGNGGPDGFGYRWVDSDDSGGPFFDWVDISGTGTNAGLAADDSNNGPFPIGFTFPFYGVEYNEFRICSNGWLSFNSTSTAYSNQPLPNGGAPTALVAPFWDDLNPSVSGDVYYEGDGTRLIVQWDNVAHYGTGGPYTFQAILYNDGTIEYQYLSIGSPDNSCTIGIQNAARNDGLQVAYNTAYVHNNLKIRIAAVPQWVTVSPNAGTIYAPNSEGFTVGFDASGLLGGTYDANIQVFSNDPDENPFLVPVQMTVVGAPDIELAPASIDFGPVFLGATPTEILRVQNPGTDVLTVSSITVDNSAYSLGMSSFTVPPRGSQDVNVIFAPTSVATYPATVTVNSDDPDQPVATMTLAGQGVEPPDFTVAPTSLSSSLFTGETETQLLTLSNGGGADLQWSAGVEFIAASQLFMLTAPVTPTGTDEDGGVAASEFRTTPIQAELADLTGLEIMWDRSHGQTSTASWATIIADIEARGATVTMNTNPITPALLANYDVIWSVDTNSSWDAAEIAALSNWMDTGGGLLLEGDNFSSVGIYNELLTALGAGIEYSTTSGASGTTSNIYAHPTTENVTEVYFTANVASIPTIGAPAEPLVDDVNGVGAAAASQVGAGRIFATSDEIFQSSRMGTADNQLFGNQVMDWLAGTNFLTLDPTSGVVPPGGSFDISVLFDATGLFGGLYEANVNIETNDPLAPLVQVPTALQVTGAPDLSLDPTSIDFGNVFVGYPDLHQFEIFNAGTDLLTINSIVSDDPAFTVFLGGGTFPIQLAAQTSTVLQVRFAPAAPVGYGGTLSIHSNDPNTPEALAVSGAGLIAPVADAAPTSLSSALFTGETETQLVTLSNTGGSDLVFSIAQQLTPDAVVVHESIDVGKNEVDTRPGILGSGGPDAFGYSWVDSDDPGGPTFNWVDISATGTPAFTSTGDDRNFGPFPIGFNFPFYGTDFSEFRVCSNGWVSFTNTTTDLSNDPLPASGAPENLLAVFWDDLVVDLSIGGNVYYEYDGTRLIIQYDGVRRFGSGGPYTFEILLYPTGKIEYQYLSMQGTRLDESTIGIQNATRDDGLTIVYNDNYVHDNLAIRIATTPDWLTASPSDGVVPPGGSMPINVTFDATGLFGGVYDGAVLINNNDPANGLIEITAQLDVTGIPILGVEPTTLDFGNQFIGYPESQTLTVTNIGTDLLSISSISSGLSDYSVDLSAFDLAPLASQDVLVTFDPQVDGDRGTTLSIVSNDSNSPHDVPLAGIGVIPPVIAVSPDPIVGAALPGGSKTKTLTVCNNGGSDLVFEVAESENTSAVQVYSELELAKATDTPGSEEEVDPRPSILGSGGPDTFGYSWIDSDEPGGPTYDWTDISTVGSPVGFPSYADDGNVGPVPIGFSFPFYGNTFTELNVCSNGWLSFTNSTLRTYTNQPLPNSGSSTPENLLAPWWDDMVYDESDGNNAYYYNDGSRLIIQMYIRRIGAFTPPFYRFQVILYPNGNIVYQYETLGTRLNSSTIGIQNGTKDDGLTVVHNDGSYIHEEMAILFSAGTDWLGVSPTSGVVPAGECAELAVNMNAADLEAGDYNGTITLTSNDPANPTVGVDAVFHVGSIDAADTSIDPESLNLMSNGNWITAQVELPMGYDPADVVIETVLFMGVLPADPDLWSWDDDFNDNGVPDLMFKFDRMAAEELLPTGEAVDVWVTGEIRDTTYFVASDQVRVFRPHLMSPAGGETLMAGASVVIEWQNPENRSVDSADLFYSADDGATWIEISTGIQDTRFTWTVAADVTESGRVRVAVYDANGLLGFDTNDEAFAVADGVTDAGQALPKAYALRQNVPNPFNPITTIHFDLIQSSNVALQIYDVRGRVVKVLLDEWMPAGRHQVIWNGLDRSGRRAPSGVYFYAIEAGSFQATKRMTVLK